MCVYLYLYEKKNTPDKVDKKAGLQTIELFIRSSSPQLVKSRWGRERDYLRDG